jgi:hypothetical protein
MDDLDRLTPEELLVVFKLVRLVGHLPGVYYLISFDERTLLDVLQRSELVGNSEPRAREFLEKIVQVRLDLPAFRERDADLLVDRSLAAVLASNSLTLTPGEQQRLSEAYYRHLQARLRTPRAIKRFFGQVDATLGQLTGNVDIVDFLLVTFLRTSEPRAYQLLWQHRAELTGTSVDLPSRPDEQPEQLIDRWRTRLQDAGVAEQHLDSVIGLMGMLFAPLRQALGYGANTQAIALRRGIGSIDYFDRYMVFGIPDDDLPEHTFDTALQQLADGTPGTEADELLLRLRDDTQRITRRIQYKRAAGTPLPVAALLKAAARQYGHLAATPQGAQHHRIAALNEPEQNAIELTTPDQHSIHLTRQQPSTHNPSPRPRHHRPTTAPAYNPTTQHQTDQPRPAHHPLIRKTAPGHGRTAEAGHGVGVTVPTVEAGPEVGVLLAQEAMGFVCRIRSAGNFWRRIRRVPGWLPFGLQPREQGASAVGVGSNEDPVGRDEVRVRVCLGGDRPAHEDLAVVRAGDAGENPQRCFQWDRAVVAHLKGDGQAGRSRCCAGTAHEFVQEHGAHAAVAVAGRPFVGDAERAVTHQAVDGGRHLYGRGQRASGPGHWAVDTCPCGELVHLGDLRPRPLSARQLAGDGADAVRHTVEGVRGGGGADGGFHQGAQFVAEVGDRRLRVFQFLFLGCRSRGVGGSASGRRVGEGSVHRVSRWGGLVGCGPGAVSHRPGRRPASGASPAARSAGPPSR